MRLFGWFRPHGRAAATRSSIVTEDRRFRQIGGRRYVRGSPYLLPKDDAEIHRLDFQHYMLRYALRSNYLAPIGQPRDILDVGTGTGRWATEMALAFPAANVVGVDLVTPAADTEAEKQTQGGLDVRPDNYTFVTANILERLPFPGMSFDFVHQRLLVGAIPAVRWPDDIAEMVRVTRLGGWVELVEAAPPPGGGPALQALRTWLVQVCEKRGLDPVVGPRIGEMLQAAGLQNVRYQETDLPIGRYGGRLGTLTETNLVSFYTSIRGLVLMYELATGEQFDAALAQARQEIARGRWIWPYFVAFGQRPTA